MYEDDYLASENNDYYNPNKRRNPFKERTNRQHNDYETRFSNLSLENDYKDRNETNIKPSKYNGLKLFKETKNASIYDEDEYFDNKENLFGDTYENRSKNKRKNKFNDNLSEDDDRYEFTSKNKRKMKFEEDVSEDDERNRRQKSNRRFFDTFYENKKTKNTGSRINIVNDIRDISAKELSPKETSIKFDKLQRELDLLKEKQKESMYYKENMVKMVEREVEKARREIELEKNEEIEIFKEKHKNEMRKKDARLREAKEYYDEHLDKYKNACIKRIKLEKLENERRLDVFKSFYEEKLLKYKNAYVKLKEKYKNDLFKKFTDM